ncbi:MAG TPA: hypothetical protein PLI09_28610, partial [Candidatus Hydrogenedentes bacterium]|nr:hypothetical protein [Candidatus Hydrogenedentota bacterium]
MTIFSGFYFASQNKSALNFQQERFKRRTKQETRGGFMVFSRQPNRDKKIGAGHGVRTRDIQLGKLTLYQL